MNEVLEALAKIDAKLAYLVPLSLEELTHDEQRQAFSAKMHSASLEEIADFCSTNPDMLAIAQAQQDEEDRITAERARLAGAENDDTLDKAASAYRSSFEKYVKPTLGAQ